MQAKSEGMLETYCNNVKNAMSNHEAKQTLKTLDLVFVNVYKLVRDFPERVTRHLSQTVKEKIMEAVNNSKYHNVGVKYRKLLFPMLDKIFPPPKCTCQGCMLFVKD